MREIDFDKIMTRLDVSKERMIEEQPTMLKAREAYDYAKAIIKDFYESDKNKPDTFSWREVSDIQHDLRVLGRMDDRFAQVASQASRIVEEVYEPHPRYLERVRGRFIPKQPDESVNLRDVDNSALTEFAEQVAKKRRERDDFER